MAQPAGAVLLGITPGLPALSFDNTGTLSYTAASGAFTATVSPAFALFPPASVRPVLPDTATGQRSAVINIQLDSSGALVGGVAGDDLVVTGKVDTTGDGIYDADGVLLTGEIVAFGSQDTGTTNDDFDFRFHVTGGQLAGLFAGQDIGIHLDAENSAFVGVFSANFAATFVKGSLGPVPTECIDLKKQISIDGGVTWADADTPDAVDVPVSAVPGDAEYRLVVNNCGTGALTNVQVNDATLNLSYLIGDLAAGATQTVTQAELSGLYVVGRCGNAGVLINSASVTGESTTTTETVSDTNDAVIRCVTTPQIDIKKQISVDGGLTWLDADTSGTAPLVTAPHGAEYRFVVTNTGTAALTGVVINDATLGIVDYPVGDLAVGASVTVGSGEIPAASVAERCANPGEFTNTASTSGQSVDDGSTVNDSDIAILQCAGQPGIEIVKQISVDGGATWLDANAAGDPDTPTVPFPHGAEYRFIVRNIGQADLVNVSVSDPDLGVNYTIPGVLAVGAEVTVSSGDVGGLLTIATRCDSTGTLTNVVSVTGESSDTGEKVTDSDAAVINCIGTPGIKLRKQISLDGTTWADADSAGAADTPSAEAPADAYYRFLVSNVGNVDLVNVVLSDPTLGVVYTIGSLAVGQNTVVDSGVIPNGLFVAQRCSTAGDFVNIADVSGDAADTGATVTDTNPAVLTCTTPPPTIDGQGCTPGYWRQPQHYGNWSGGYTPDTQFSAVFEDAFPGQTLGEVVQIKGGGLNALGRHTVAALLNAASDSVGYGMTPAEVIAAFNAVYPGSDTDYETLKNQFAAMNERGCPLSRACLPGTDTNGKSGHGGKSYDQIEPNGSTANCDTTKQTDKTGKNCKKDGYTTGGGHGGKSYDQIEPNGNKANCDTGKQDTKTGKNGKKDGTTAGDGYGGKSYDQIQTGGSKANCKPGQDGSSGGYGGSHS